MVVVTKSFDAQLGDVFHAQAVDAQGQTLRRVSNYATDGMAFDAVVRGGLPAAQEPRRASDLARRVVARYQAKTAVAKPYDLMLEALKPKEGELDTALIKRFSKAFADRLSKNKNLARPSEVQKAAREAAHAVDVATNRPFYVGAQHLGELIAAGWKKAMAPEGAKGGDAFVEGLQDTLKRKAPLSDRDWVDAVEYGLGFAEGELGVRL